MIATYICRIDRSCKTADKHSTRMFRVGIELSFEKCTYNLMHQMHLQGSSFPIDTSLDYITTMVVKLRAFAETLSMSPNPI